MAFLPGSYALAERMKRPVQRTGAAFKEQAGACLLYTSRCV